MLNWLLLISVCSVCYSKVYWVDAGWGGKRKARMLPEAALLPCASPVWCRSSRLELLQLSGLWRSRTRDKILRLTRDCLHHQVVKGWIIKIWISFHTQYFIIWSALNCLQNYYINIWSFPLFPEFFVLVISTTLETVSSCVKAPDFSPSFSFMLLLVLKINISPFMNETIWPDLIAGFREKRF